jgi:hypothetical protein
MSELRPGDVAVVAVNTDGTEDEFAWVALRAIPSNTVINFTDSSVSNGWFRWTEHFGDTVAPGPLTWRHSETLPAGAVVQWGVEYANAWSIGQATGGGPQLSIDGDQLVLYQGNVTNNPALSSPWRGDASGARMLFALDFANAGWGLVAGKETTTSMIPSGLSTAACTAAYVSPKDNGYYNGPRTGTVDQLLAAIATPTNWVCSDDLIDAALWIPSMTVNPHPGTSISIK